MDILQSSIKVFNISLQHDDLLNQPNILRNVMKLFRFLQANVFHRVWE